MSEMELRRRINKWIGFVLLILVVILFGHVLTGCSTDVTTPDQITLSGKTHTNPELPVPPLPMTEEERRLWWAAFLLTLSEEDPK